MLPRGSLAFKFCAVVTTSFHIAENWYPSGLLPIHRACLQVAALLLSSALLSLPIFILLRIGIPADYCPSIEPVFKWQPYF
jgi:hypothetical protein